MSDEEPKAADTPKEDPKPETDWEKRYKDMQSDLTKTKQELARTKEYVDAVTTAYTPADKSAPTEDDDAYVTKGDLRKFMDDLQSTRKIDKAESYFETNYPDMRAHEDLVGQYLQKTDARLPYNQRIDRAVEFVKERIEVIKAEALTEAESAKLEQQKKEAEVAGLEVEGAEVPREKEEPPPETAEDYVARRRRRYLEMSGEVVPK